MSFAKQTNKRSARRRAPVAQLDRASACGAEGHRFKSCRVYQMRIIPNKTPVVRVRKREIIRKVVAKAATFFYLREVNGVRILIGCRRTFHNESLSNSLLLTEVGDYRIISR